MPASFIPHPSSYRDPSGFMFGKDGVLYRQVNLSYKEHFEKFISSGLYDDLQKQGLLIPHREIRENLTGTADWFTTLEPENIPFISYPYEWSFSMLKDAALLTLGLAKLALKHGMILKDATPFNIQFHQSKPVFIDSLSFEIYNESEPWIAYRQFCECFLSPILLAHHLKQPVHSLLLSYPEGIPLGFTAAALPSRTKFSLHTYLHIHMHAKAKAGKLLKKDAKFSRKKLMDILTSLEIAIHKCLPPTRQTAWSSYYEEASGRKDYLDAKSSLVKNWLEKINVRSAVDLGANTGVFSRLVAAKSIPCIATDADPYCIDEMYRLLRNEHGQYIHPLISDLANPAPSIGLNNTERSSFLDRIRGTELVMALALVHHLSIAKNIPLEMVAALFDGITGKYLIIEFVPRHDVKVQLLLSGREDIFKDYNPNQFEKSFFRHFRLLEKQEISDSGRILYFLEK